MTFSRTIQALFSAVFIAIVFFVAAPAHAADTTKPTISLTSPEEATAVQGTVPLTFVITDESVINSFTVDTFESNPYRYVTIGRQNTIASGNQTIAWDTLLVKDGYYTLVVTAIDQMNNANTVNYHFAVNNHATFAQPVLNTVFLNPEEMSTVKGLTQIQAHITDNSPITKVSEEFVDDAGSRIIDYQLVKTVIASEYDKTYTWQFYADYFTPGTYHFRLTVGSPEFSRTVVRSFVVAKPVSTEPKYIANALVKTDAAKGRTLQGKVLIQTENQKRLWYVLPKEAKRIYLGQATLDVGVLRKTATAISSDILKGIPIAGTTAPGSQANRQKYAGYFLKVAKSDQVWYVDPKSKQRFLVSDPTTNRATLTRLGTKVTNATLAAVPLKDGVTQGRRVVKTSVGSFSVSFLSFDRRNPGLRIMTDSATTKPCRNNCPTVSLAEYARRRGAYAAINGSYFCPTGYAQCKGKTNSFDFQLFNSFTQTAFNRDRANLGYSSSYAAFDTANVPVMDYSNGVDQASPMTQHGNELIAKGGTGKVRAVIYNQPRLVAKRKNVASLGLVEPKDKARTSRSVIGWKGNTIYLMVVSGATVNQAAAVAVAMGLDEALNLDGGGSTALYTEGKYIAGPGRNVANAILILPQ